jgi:metallo-beta-lactamase class B
MNRRIALSVALSVSLAPRLLAAQQRPAASAPDTQSCSRCAEWNAPQRPFRVFGNTYYVGTHGLGAILVTSPRGHVLIDGGIPQSAPQVLANVRALGFRVGDIRLILNSHAHFDHAGGIAAVQRASGARVAASAASAPVLRRGASGPNDPQYGSLPGFPAVRGPVRVVADGDTVRVGELALTLHATPGHTPGGTTWSWRSCEAGRCLDIVYADSQTPVSADGFFFSRNTTYPGAVADFERGAQLLEHLSCDVLLTPHPEASGLWERLAARDAGNRDALIDRAACTRLAATARQQLARRLADERTKLGG